MRGSLSARNGRETPPSREWGTGAALAGLLIAVAAVTPTVVKYLTNPPDQRMVDLDVYRYGGLAVLRGAPLYGFLTQPPQLLPFTYPPFAALLAVPLALMSWPVAQWSWVVMVYAALAVVVRYAFGDLIRSTGRWAPVTAGVIFGMAAHLQPVNDQIRFGQVGVFLMAMCVADCMAGSPRWPRGVLIGLATAIKLVPGVFLIYLLITGRRRAAGNAVVTAAAVTLGAFTVLPWDSAHFWLGAGLDSGRAGANNATTNQSVNGMLLRLYWPSAVTTAVWLCCVVLLAYGGFRLARRAGLLAARSSGPVAHSAELAGVAVTGLLAVLLSPIGWVHHLVWLVVVLGALAGDGHDRRRLVPAVLIWAAYVLPIPWWGSRLHTYSDGVIIPIVGRIVQDSFGLGAILLIMLLGLWLVPRLSRENDDDRSAHAVTTVGTLAP